MNLEIVKMTKKIEPAKFFCHLLKKVLLFYSKNVERFNGKL